MATAKQLAALKKARAARKRNLAKKNPVKKRRVRKKIAAKNPIKKRVVKRKTNPRKKTGYIVRLKMGSKMAYYVRPNAFDTLKSKAAVLSQTAANRVASRIFNTYKANSLLEWVKVEKKP